MKPLVYIDTTIPSFYHEIRTDPEESKMAHPTIERIRKVRREIAREAGSFEKLVRQLQKWQQEHPERMTNSEELKPEVSEADAEGAEESPR